MILTLFVLSLFGAFCSGLLGVGGAVLLIPLLLTVPKLVGVGELSMHEVAGLTMIQVLAASLTGTLAHRRSGFTHMPTIMSIGIPMGIFSFAGAAVSKTMSGDIMLITFGCLVVLAFSMLLKRSANESADVSDIKFNKFPFIVVGSCVGFVSGVVGAGGGFILIPVMTRILRIPMRAAVGSSLGIVLIGALMGSLGKILTLQVQWIYLVPVIGGSLPASLLGAYISKKIQPSRIRHVLLLLVLIILIKTWYDIIHILMSAS